MQYLIIFLFLFFATSCKKESFKLVYYPDNILKAKIPIDKDSLYHGKAYFFSKNKGLSHYIFYNHGYKDSTIYFDTNEKIKRKIIFLKERNEKLYFDYFENGDLQKRINYVNDTIIDYKEYDTTSKLLSHYKRINIQDIPDFDRRFIKTKKVRSDTFSTIKIIIPGVPSSQIHPILFGGTIFYKNKVEGLYKAKASEKLDSVYLGIRILLHDSTKIFYGKSKLEVISSPRPRKCSAGHLWE